MTLNLILSINFSVGIVKNATLVSRFVIFGLSNPTELSKHPHVAVPEYFDILQRIKATKTAEAISKKTKRSE